MEEVFKFLTSIELPHLLCKFEEEEITMDALLEMTEENLKEIGIKMGPRKLILKGLREHNASRTSRENKREDLQDPQKNKSNGNGAECIPHDIDNGEEFEAVSSKKDDVIKAVKVSGPFMVGSFLVLRVSRDDETTIGDKNMIDCYLRKDDPLRVPAALKTWKDGETVSLQEFTTDGIMESVNWEDCIRIVYENDKTESGKTTDAITFESVVVKEEEDQPTDSDCSETTVSEVTLLLEKVSNLKSKSKESLCTIYQEIRRLFESQCVFQELKQEMLTEYGNNIIGILEDLALDISDDSCPIVITGETSAGKSTFVNLLLGVDLMPKSPLTCTSTICRISNKPYKAMFLTDLKNNRHKVPDFDSKDDTAIQELLTDYLCQETQKKPKEEYKYVDIWWPFLSLQSNVMIVDTPGIGPDDPELTKRLFEYLPQALAFIYILNTPNAGGVQSDRILRVQEEIGKQSHLDPTKQFDPRRAIFICNKWDQIFEHPDKVFNKIQTLLEDTWSGFQKDKLFKLSARQAAIEFSAKKLISEDFRKIVKGIENLIPLTTEAKVRRHLQWQRNFINRMRLKLSARILNSLKSKEEKTNLLREIEGRIQKVKLESEETRKKIYENAAKKCNFIKYNIKRHLNNDATKSKMFSWSDETLPNFDQMVDNDKRLNETIRCKIAEELTRELKKEFVILTDYIRDLFNAELCIIGRKFRDIDLIIIGEHATLLTVQDKDFEINVGLPNSNQNEAWLDSMVERLPLPLAMALLGVLSTGLSIVAMPIWSGMWIVDKFNDKKLLAEYRKDKIKYANEMVDSYLNSIEHDMQYNTMPEVLLKNLKFLIQEYFENIIPKRIAAGEALIENIRADLRAPREIREQCHETEISLLPVYGRIVLAYYDILEEDLLAKDDTKSCQQQGYENCSFRLESRWSRIVAINQKCSTHTDRELVALAEISNLRTCAHDNLVTIYGKLSLICIEVYMEMCDTTLDNQVIEGKLEWEMCSKYLKDSLKGLNYLHDCGLVHKNIRLGNIQIKNNNAKLSGGGITEWESLTGTIECIPIIRAPEVVKNRYCGYEADMFQFGVVLWECWYKKRAFCQDDKPVKSTYEELYATIIDGDRPLFPQPQPNEYLLSVIENCWQNNPDCRLSAKEVVIEYSLPYFESLVD